MYEVTHKTNNYSSFVTPCGCVDRWQKPYSLDPSQTLGDAFLSSGGFRHGRHWVYWSFLITVGYLAILILLTALALQILNRECSYPFPTKTLLGHFRPSKDPGPPCPES